MLSVAYTRRRYPEVIAVASMTQNSGSMAISMIILTPPTIPNRANETIRTRASRLAGSSCSLHSWYDLTIP